MRASFAAAGLVALSALPAQSQSARPEASGPVAVPLENFRLSGPPALGLLGASASSVLRPNTPRELIASLVSGAGSDGLVPGGYSLETAPYWLVRHRALELRDYHSTSLWDRLRYFTAVSVATARIEASGDSVARDAHVAAAIRTLLANGRPSRALLALGDSIRAQQLSYIERYRRWELAQRTLARRDSLRAQVRTGEAAANDAARFAEDLDGIESKLAVLAKRFAREEIEPDGFVLEVAAGTRARFERGEWSRQRVDGAGVWITPMYRIGSNGFELIGVARYLSHVDEYGGRNLFDLGVRAGIDIGKGSLFAEHVWRSLHGAGDLVPGETGAGTSRSSTRWDVAFDYPLGGNLWVVASFGSDYRRPAGVRPVIATIGLNLGFGAIEILPSGSR